MEYLVNFTAIHKGNKFDASVPVVIKPVGSYKLIKLLSALKLSEMGYQFVVVNSFVSMECE